MNEQIRELIKQYDLDLTIDGMGYGEGNIEGLVELIVNRCASIVSLYRRDNLQDKAIADTFEMAYKEIKLSFGMKP